MKRILLVMLLCFSLAAQAADVTITLTISEADLARIQTAVGKAAGLVDPDTGASRNATPTEVKAFMVQRANQLIISTEGAALIKAATDAVVVPAFTIK